MNRLRIACLAFLGIVVYRQVGPASDRLLPDANRIDLTPAGAGRFRFVVQAMQRTHPGAGGVNIGEIDGTMRRAH